MDAKVPAKRKESSPFYSFSSPSAAPSGGTAQPVPDAPGRSLFGSVPPRPKNARKKTSKPDTRLFHDGVAPIDKHRVPTKKGDVRCSDVIANENGVPREDGVIRLHPSKRTQKRSLDWFLIPPVGYSNPVSGTLTLFRVL